MLECLQSRQIETANAKFFIYNLRSDSQADVTGSIHVSRF